MEYMKRKLISHNKTNFNFVKVYIHNEIQFYRVIILNLYLDT
jgi:hypothetical protein